MAANPMIEKRQFCGPNTALCCTCFGGAEYLLWGSGGTLHGYNRETGEQFSLQLFEHNMIHDIISYPESSLIIVFGSISFQLLVFDSKKIEVRSITKERCLDDMILNCALAATTETYHTILIGYAHNFYDIVKVHQETGKLTLVNRYHCLEKVALFTLSFSCKSLDDMIVASGDVFGKLIIWRGFNDENGKPCSQILASGHLHEGVVFRITWNNNRDKLLTVSDDRTLRRWDLSLDFNANTYTMTQKFVGWGHVSRLWDAIFITSDENTIATCSEDGTIKLWDDEGKCMTTLVGHNGSIWRIAVDATYETLISAGNDASIKTWNISFHRNTSPHNESSTLTEMNIPSWSHPVSNSASLVDAEGENDTVVHSKKDNRRNNGVSWLKVSPCGKYVLMVLMNGKVWLVNLRNDEKNSRFDIDHWYPVIDVNEIIVTADVYFYAEQDGQENQEISFFIVLAPLRGPSHYVQATMSTLNNFVTIRSHDTWTAHPYKMVNIWISEDNNHDVQSNGSSLLVMTSTLHGICSFWKFSFAQPHSMTRLFTVQTEKQEIATSFKMKHTKHNMSYFIIGDSRGSVNLFNLSLMREKEANFRSNLSTEENPSDNAEITTKLTEDATMIHLPDQVHLYLHNTDPVSAIALSKNGFMTVGHDNILNYYSEVFVPLVTNNFDLRWVLESSVTTMPLHTPDQIFVVDGHEVNDIGNASIYVCGYHGSSYLVYDLRRGYQVMRIEGGGWKRPHFGRLMLKSSSSSRNQLPEVVFACPAPVGKKETSLQIFGSHIQSTVSRIWPLQLGCTSFGKVSYAGLIIPYSFQEATESITIVGGEDCTLKVFNSTTESMLQEITLSKNSSLKCLASIASSPNSGLIVGGGGKLLYYIWAYHFEEENHFKKYFTPIRKIYVGSAWPNASQDHRIMSIDIQSIGSYNKDGEKIEQYLLLLTDSRGVMTIIDVHINMDLDATNKTYLQRVIYLRQYANVDVAHVRYQLEVSPCPLLSSSLVVLETKQVKYFLASVGDTRGQVILVLIPILQPHANESYLICKPKIICDYVAHAMGTNALTAVLMSNISSITEEHFWHFVICSAGDDQSVAAQELRLGIRYLEENQQVTCTLSPTAKYLGGASTALKGIAYLNHTKFDVFRFSTIACDQRLSVWEVNGLNEVINTNDKEELKWINIPFYFHNENGSSIVENISETTQFFFPSLAAASRYSTPTIRWISGSISHVTEISSMAIALPPSSSQSSSSQSVRPLQAIVIGEGFELINITN